jgi:thioredoxin-related protein
MCRIIRLPFGLVPVLILQAVLAHAAGSKEVPWPTNFQAAQVQAKAQSKTLLVAFTGSDWCPWCQKLKTEVFDKPPFPAAVRKQFVVVDIDFPHEKKLPDQLKEQNDKLAKRYGAYTYPTVLLLKPDGTLMARTGYMEGGPEKYLKRLAFLTKTYQNVTELRQQLPTAAGLDRAKLLDQLIGGYDKLNNQIGPIAGWRKEIVALDPDNEAGLKHKYEFRVYLDDARSALGAGRPKVAEATIDKALALPGLNPGQVQNAAIVKSNCYVARKDFQASLDCLRKALKAAPKGQNVDELKELIQKSEKLLEGQQKKTGEQKGA